MSYAWIDYTIEHIDIVVAEAKPEGRMRQVVASLFLDAARRGWDVANAALYIARRVENWNATMRLALTPPPDVVEKWTARGWMVQPLPDEIRAQLLELLPHVQY